MVFSAYRDYKRQMALEQMEREEKAAEAARERKLREQKREAAIRAAALTQERKRVARVIEEHSLSLPVEARRALLGEPGGCSCGCPHCCPATDGAA